jgi:hypothetical protein
VTWITASLNLDRDHHHIANRRSGEAPVPDHRITILRRIGLSAALVMAVSTLATSQGFAFSAEAQQMCTGDAFRLCAAEMPSIPRITACIRKNKSSLTPGCRAVLDKEDGKKVATTRN